MTDFAWTEDRVEVLTQLFNDGFSASEMANEMGQRYRELVSRNAVIGKLHRIGLRRGRNGNRQIEFPAKPRIPRQRPRTARRAPLSHGRIKDLQAAQNAPAPVSEPSSAFQCDIMGLNNQTCRFPVNDGSPYLFCGSPQADMAAGIRYCPYHSKRAFGRQAEAETWKPLGEVARSIVEALKP